MYKRAESRPSWRRPYGRNIHEEGSVFLKSCDYSDQQFGIIQKLTVVLKIWKFSVGTLLLLILSEEVLSSNDFGMCLRKSFSFIKTFFLRSWP